MICRVSLKTLIDTGRGDLLSGEMGLAGQFDLSTKQKMLIQVTAIITSQNVLLCGTTLLQPRACYGGTYIWFVISRDNNHTMIHLEARRVRS